MAEAGSADLLALRAEQKEKKDKYDALQSEISKMVNHIERQNALLGETKMCMDELSRLDDSASIYKLTGPILVKQDLDMSKSTVKERLTFIKAQLGKLEKAVDEKKATVDALTNELRALFGKIKAAEAAAAGAAPAASE